MSASNLTYRFHPVPIHRFFWVEFQLAKTLVTVLEKSVPAVRYVCYSAREAIEWLRPEQAAEICANLLPGETWRY